MAPALRARLALDLSGHATGLLGPSRRLPNVTAHGKIRRRLPYVPFW
jgi:hypothetical protein